MLDDAGSSVVSIVVQNPSFFEGKRKTEIFDGLLLEGNLLFFLVLMFGYCKHYLLTIQTKPQS